MPRALPFTPAPRAPAAGLPALLAAAALGCAAGAPRRAAAPAPEAGAPAPAEPARPADLVVVATEAVGSAGEDAFAALRVYVDGALRGEAEGRRSSELRWEGRVGPGNRLVRVERWLLPRVGGWEPDGEGQPGERFVRVEEGRRTVYRLRFTDGGRRRQHEVIRE